MAVALAVISLALAVAAWWRASAADGRVDRLERELIELRNAHVSFAVQARIDLARLCRRRGPELVGPELED